MLAVIISAFIILLLSLASDITYSKTAKDLIRNDDSGILRELLERMDKMQSQMNQMETKNNIRLDQMERNNNIRFDKIEANNLDMQSYIKNLSVVMETIVEQQMVITAEIFTVSQTLPFCCCQYQNTTDPPEIKTTTTDTGKPETTTPTTLTSLPTNCADAMGERGPDGIYQINVTDSNIGPFDVYCMNKVDNEIINGKWLIIHRRQNGANFYQNWTMYQHGFGDMKKSFWIGLDKIHALTKSTDQELWIELEDDKGRRGWGKYSHFSIGSEKELYRLKHLVNFAGPIGDKLDLGTNWSTFDRDNDNWHKNCAVDHKGAWWFHSCSFSNLNGVYGDRTGYSWYAFCGPHCWLKYSHMAVRPVD